MAAELEIPIACSCGRSVKARSKDAGGWLTCSCGAMVAIPRLSELRTMAGADAYITNAAEAIRKLQNEGVDPSGEKCIGCGSTPDMHYDCIAVCESSYLHKETAGEPNFIVQLLMFVLIPWFIALYLLTRKWKTEVERRGYDVQVSFPLPVCKLCEAAYGNVTRPKVAKRLMLNVPVYAELLNAYPNAQLEIRRIDASKQSAVA